MREVLPTVDPATALDVGLKVDVAALPSDLIAALRAGKVDLTDPAVTVALLRLNAVVGVKGTVDKSGHLKKVGVTCALCHSTVDNSFAPSIGPTPRWLGEHRPERWRDRRTVPGTGRRHEG